MKTFKPTIQDVLHTLGITYPLIQAPMAGGITTPELVAAVSNQGGLGSLGAGYMLPQDIANAIRRIRALTPQPFAVNLFIPTNHFATETQILIACAQVQRSCDELNLKISPPVKPYVPHFEEQLKVLLAEEVPIVSFTFGILDQKWKEVFHSKKIKLIGTATTLQEALVLQNSGMDMIVAQGVEAGGHRGTFIGKMEDGLIKLKKLIALLNNQLEIPVIAAGGIMNKAGVTAALQWGAVAVQMGTAFLTCKEAGTYLAYKQALLKQKNDNTILTRAFSGKYARGIKNIFSERMALEEAILEYPIQNSLTSSMRKYAAERGIIDYMSLWAGQFAYLCRELTVKELMNSLEKGA